MLNCWQGLCEIFWHIQFCPVLNFDSLLKHIMFNNTILFQGLSRQDYENEIMTYEWIINIHNVLIT